MADITIKLGQNGTLAKYNPPAIALLNVNVINKDLTIFLITIILYINRKAYQ